MYCIDRTADQTFLETDQTVFVVNTNYAFICREVTTDPTRHENMSV